MRGALPAGHRRGPQPAAALLEGAPTRGGYSFERFSPAAQAVLDLAHRRAVERQQRYIGTEHMLLGLLAEPSGAGGRLLREVCDQGEIDAELDRVLPKGDAVGDIMPTSRVKKVIELGFANAE